MIGAKLDEARLLCTICAERTAKTPPRLVVHIIGYSPNNKQIMFATAGEVESKGPKNKNKQEETSFATHGHVTHLEERDAGSYAALARLGKIGAGPLVLRITPSGTSAWFPERRPITYPRDQSFSFGLGCP